jgi:hypothetical protein
VLLLATTRPLLIKPKDTDRHCCTHAIAVTPSYHDAKALLTLRQQQGTPPQLPTVEAAMTIMGSPHNTYKQEARHNSQGMHDMHAHMRASTHMRS